MFATHYRDPREFLKYAQKLLEQEPDVHHHIRQIADTTIRRDGYFEPPFHFWIVKDDDTPIGCALVATPDGLVVSGMPPRATELVFSEVAGAGLHPTRISGHPKSADQVVNLFSSNFGSTYSDRTDWTVATLEEVQKSWDKPVETLCIRTANADTAKTVLDWADVYSNERPAFLDVRNFVSMKLRDNELYILHSDEPLAMATISGTSAYGTRISMVFTPPENRGNGYASDLVRRLSKVLFETGTRFILLTWRSGDRVGELYKRLGFKKVGSLRSYNRS